MSRFLFIWSLIFFCSATVADGSDGDVSALQRVEQMLESIGGREAWANAKSLYTMERAWHPTYGDGIVASYWHDLEKPGEFTRLSVVDREIVYGWNEQGGWISRDGELRDYKSDELAERRFYWHREIYTLYHQLAEAKRDLTVKSTERNGFVVIDEADEIIGEFRLTPEGSLYFWGQTCVKDPVAYVYGPHKNFGAITFPGWGTSTDGKWGFYYVQVKPSNKPFDAHVDMTRPEKAWSGGAIKKDKCPD